MEKEVKLGRLALILYIDVTHRYIGAPPTPPGIFLCFALTASAINYYAVDPARDRLSLDTNY